MTEPEKPKLNEWVTEEREVQVYSPEFDKNGNFKLNMGTKKIKEKAMYVEPTSTTVICSDHDFTPAGNNVFVCSRCGYHFKAYPVTYDFRNGKLIHKITKKVI